MGFFRRKEPELFERPAPAPATQGPVQVVLLDTGSNKIQVIKLVREATGLGLKDSKDLVDAAPSTIGGFTEAAAPELVAALQKAGARAEAASARPWEPAGTGSADTVAMRQAVWERDGGRCARCGAQQDLQYDHIIPLSRGGADTADNLQLLCAPCARAKGESIG